jgi:hypothetical protein
MKLIEVQNGPRKPDPDWSTLIALGDIIALGIVWMGPKPKFKSE